jgi:hypothetical protein
MERVLSELPASVQPCFLQFESSLRYPLTTYTQHIGDQFLRHHELVTLQSIEAQQQPSAQLLIQRMMAVANCGLRHLCNKGLRVAQQQMQDLIVVDASTLVSAALKVDSIPERALLRAV